MSRSHSREHIWKNLMIVFTIIASFSFGLCLDVTAAHADIILPADVEIPTEDTCYEYDFWVDADDGVFDYYSDDDRRLYEVQIYTHEPAYAILYYTAAKKDCPYGIETDMWAEYTMRGLHTISYSMQKGVPQIPLDVFYMHYSADGSFKSVEFPIDAMYKNEMTHFRLYFYYDHSFSYRAMLNWKFVEITTIDQELKRIASKWEPYLKYIPMDSLRIQSDGYMYVEDIPQWVKRY